MKEEQALFHNNKRKNDIYNNWVIGILLQNLIDSDKNCLRS